MEELPQRSGRLATNELKRQIAQLSREMRKSEDPAWVRIRELLRARDVDPETAVVAQFHSEDTNMLLGIVATPGRRVFLFTFDFLHRSVEEGQFTEWEDLTGKRTETEYVAFASEIECALDLVPPGLR